MDQTITIDTEVCLHDSLFIIKHALEDGAKRIAFTNKSTQRQYVVKCTFVDGVVRPLAKTSVKDGVHAVTVYPAMRTDFVEGTWRSMKRTILSMAPDDGYMTAAAVELSASTVETEITTLRAAMGDTTPIGQYAEKCEALQIPFVDVEFPPVATSLFLPHERKATLYPWLRAREFVAPGAIPQVYLHKIEPRSIDQGRLGSCSLMCSLGAVSETEAVVMSMFRRRQTPELGVYRVDLVKSGWWTTVTLDDYFPCLNGSQVFARNREDPEELWVSLVEKGYAKLLGSYQAITRGDPSYTLADLTGFATEKFKDLFEFGRLEEWSRKQYLLTLNTAGERDGSDQSLASKYAAVGLATGHAYTLLRAVTLNGHQLCKIRNPWGGDYEWNGDWGDDSPLWTPEMVVLAGFERASDGIFWMAFSDVCEYFRNGCVCFMKRDSAQVRVRDETVRGGPSRVLRVTCTSAVDVSLGIHQAETRGVSPQDLRQKQVAGFRVAVYSAAGHKAWESAGGAYQASRDVSAMGQLLPGVNYIVVDAFQGASLAYVISMHCDESALASMTTQIITRGAHSSPCPSGTFRFAISEWGDSPVEALYQTKIGLGVFHEAVGGTVVFPAAEEGGGERVGTPRLTLVHHKHRSVASKSPPKGLKSPSSVQAGPRDMGLRPPGCMVTKPGGGLFGFGTKVRWIEMISDRVMEYREGPEGHVCGRLAITGTCTVSRTGHTIEIIGGGVNKTKPKKDKYTLVFSEGTATKCDAWTLYLTRLSQE